MTKDMTQEELKDKYIFEVDLKTCVSGINTVEKTEPKKNGCLYFEWEKLPVEYLYILKEFADYEEDNPSMIIQFDNAELKIYES